MKLSLHRAVVLLILTLSVTAPAEDTTARHRSVYKEINASLDSFTKVTGTHKVEEMTYRLTGWLKQGEVVKIEASGNDPARTNEEYYLVKGKPLFVLCTRHQLNDDGKPGPRIEERFYFSEDQTLSKWLTTEKNPPVFHSEDYASMASLFNSNSSAFIAALKKAKSPDKTKAAATKTFEGTFTGIEQGDYFHWNMKSKSGEEKSFFVLSPDSSVDKVCDAPESFIGKTCRVTWKASKEFIPEANQKMDIEQVLSVEWLPKK